MHTISSRYRKPKGRPNKRRKAGLLNFEKRNSSATDETLSSESIPGPSSEAVLETSSENVHETSSEAVPGTSSENLLTNEYFLVTKSVWNTLLQKVPCQDCKQCFLDVVIHNSFGFSSKIELICKHCSKSYGQMFTSERETSSRAFDINTKVATAFLSIGKGHAALEKFSSILGSPCMDKKTFSKCLENIHNKSQETKVEMLRRSRETVRKAYLDESDILDITVSFDGTWHKRGHTSLYGIGIVIDVRTNIVVDFHVLSKYCPECTIAARDLGEESPEFEVWKTGHASECQKNFFGSSGSMEMNAAYVMWKRSISDCGMRYTTILSDGDAKTHQYLNERKVYGDFVIEKEECINHVSKRLGTALRNKVKEWRTKGVTLGGRKQGSLTEATIGKLQNFYRKAVKDNAPDITKMKASVLATLYHCMSTDAKPMHSRCPEGTSSWCFYNRAKASNQPPKPHKFMKTHLSEEVVEKIMPVYQRLAHNDILSRCTSAKTQNANESLHSCVWSKCSKDVFVSKKRIELAVSEAIKEHNLGHAESFKMNNENFTDYSLELAKRRDNRREFQKKRRSTEQYKQERNAKKYKKRAVNTQTVKAEGDTYGSGKF